jgi:diguanylate cyclase (GGDEF)-like protein
MSAENQFRILLVDDNHSIHEDFRLALDGVKTDDNVIATKAILFAKDSERIMLPDMPSYIIDSAFQGQQALECVKNAITEGQPYALAFIDIRMPPGWDGIETIQKILEVDPDMEIVICSAYSDYSWQELSAKINHSDNILILKKPFDLIEICQMALTLTKKWHLKKQVAEQIKSLQSLTNTLENSLSLIRTTLESTQEGILVLDVNLKIVTLNKTLREIWEIPENMIEYGDSTDLLHYMAGQVEDSSFFLTAMTNSKTHLNKEKTRNWKLKSGKILELYICPQYLHGNVTGSVYSFRDITEGETLKQDLLHQATHDSLTGLPNRILLPDRINQSILQASRFNLQVGVILFDLDNFKNVNDSLGHHSGDELLQLIASRLRGCVNEKDTVTRLGGDEFLILLTEQSTQENISMQAEKLLRVISNPCNINQHELIVTASMGISVYPKDGTDAETLIKNADSALYYAKDCGRNTYQFYTRAFNQLLLQRLELTTSLRQAIEKEQFSLDYQPLVDLHSGKIIGLEALIRWNHPTLGKILPQAFIPLAEEAGLITSIGEWVLRTACLQTSEWHKMGHEKMKISVNVSVRQFQQDNFVQTVLAILDEAGLEAKYLELEVTESMIMSHMSDAIDKMTELKNHGVNLTIDDFGTGYSALSYLKYFSFDKIKIDKSFIDGIGKNGSDNTVVEAIIAIAKQHGITVLAEGVEKEDQIQFMRNHHGSQVQGFYFSKPLDVRNCTELLKKQEMLDKSLV